MQLSAVVRDDAAPDCVWMTATCERFLEMRSEKDGSFNPGWWGWLGWLGYGGGWRIGGEGGGRLQMSPSVRSAMHDARLCSRGEICGGGGGEGWGKPLSAQIHLKCVLKGSRKRKKKEKRNKPKRAILNLS